MKTQNRDTTFRYNGTTLLIDTAVLPSLQVSTDNGKSWTQGGSGLRYLAGKLGVTTTEAMRDLQAKFAAAFGHKLD